MTYKNIYSLADKTWFDLDCNAVKINSSIIEISNQQWIF